MLSGLEISSLGTEPIGLDCRLIQNGNNCYLIAYSNWENIHQRNDCVK